MVMPYFEDFLDFTAEYEKLMYCYMKLSMHRSYIYDLLCPPGGLLTFSNYFYFLSLSLFLFCLPLTHLLSLALFIDRQRQTKRQIYIIRQLDKQKKHTEDYITSKNHKCKLDKNKNKQICI